VCMSATSEIQRAQPLPELLLLLTNEIPPLHFACTLAWIPARLTTIQYMSTIYPNDRMRFHDGKLPFHHLCRAGAPRSCFEWWLEQCPEAISRRTTDTGDFPLHCFLSSSSMTSTSTTTTEMELSINTQQTSSDTFAELCYLAERYPAAMRSTNRNGWLPLHLAAMSDAPLGVLFFLVREFPESVMPPVDYHPPPVVLGKRQRIS